MRSALSGRFRPEVQRLSIRLKSRGRGVTPYAMLDGDDDDDVDVDGKHEADAC